MRVRCLKPTLLGFQTPHFAFVELGLSLAGTADCSRVAKTKCIVSLFFIPILLTITIIFDDEDENADNSDFVISGWDILLKKNCGFIPYVRMRPVEQISCSWLNTESFRSRISFKRYGAFRD